MDAIAQISQRHDEIRRLLDQVAGGPGRSRSVHDHLFTRFTHLMTIDTRVAEEILYPELERFREVEQQVCDGYDDRHLIETQVEDLARIDSASDLWTEKAQVLRATVEERFTDEERGLLAFLVRACDSRRLGALAEEMRQRTAALGLRLIQLSREADARTIAPRRHLSRHLCGAG